MAESFIHYRGLIFPASEFEIDSGNRAFRYGDGLFESIRLSQGKPLFFVHHYSRMVLGMDLLGFEIPESWSLAFFRDALIELGKANKITGGRIRVSCFRGGKGLYGPDSNVPELLMEIEPLEGNFYGYNKDGMTVGLFEAHQLHAGPLSEIKSANALPYVLASVFRQQEKLDDCLMLNTAGRVAEASSSNLFIFDGKRMLTPPLSEACVAGVMRGVLIKLARRSGIEVAEETLEIEQVKSATELFLTNAIQGIRWVENFGESTYENNFSLGLFGKLEEKILADLSNWKAPRNW